jgi:hypothetical protein
VTGVAEHRGHGAVRVDHPGVGMEHDRAVEADAGPAFGCRRRCEQGGRDAARGEDRVQRPGVAQRAEVETAGQLEQRFAGLVFQLPPQPLRAAGQPHVQRVGVGTAEDPGAAVRAAAPVAGPERLEHHDRQAAG